MEIAGPAFPGDFFLAMGHAALDAAFANPGQRFTFRNGMPVIGERVPISPPCRYLPCPLYRGLKAAGLGGFHFACPVPNRRCEETVEVPNLLQFLG
jgi:hypothetical protein